MAPVPEHFQGLEHSDLSGLETSEAFGHRSSESICSFLCPAASGLKQVGESFPRYLKWTLACGVFAYRANHQVTVPAATA